MRCKKYTTEDLSAYLSRELDHEKMKEIQAHLETCNICKKEVEELKQLIGYIKSLSRLQAPEEVHEKIKEYITSPSFIDKIKRWISYPIRVPVMPVFATIATAIIIGLLYVLYQPYMSDIEHPEFLVNKYAKKVVMKKLQEDMESKPITEVKKDKLELTRKEPVEQEKNKIDSIISLKVDDVNNTKIKIEELVAMVQLDKEKQMLELAKRGVPGLAQQQQLQEKKEAVEAEDKSRFSKQIAENYKQREKMLALPTQVSEKMEESSLSLTCQIHIDKYNEFIEKIKSLGEVNIEKEYKKLQEGEIASGIHKKIEEGKYITIIIHLQKK
jgi:hypothetical protein